MRWFFLLLAAGLPLAAQTFTTSADNCAGGSPYSIPNGATVRYGWPDSWVGGDIVCTFPLAPGVYTVAMQFYEPCYQACATPVTGPGGRVFSVYAAGLPADQPILYNFDPIAAGATDTTPATRTAMLSLTGPLVLTFHTLVRGAVISGVTITPANSANSAGCLQLGAIALTLQPGTSGAIDIASRNTNVNLRLDGLTGFAGLPAYLSIAAGSQTFDVPPQCDLSLAVNDTGGCLNFTIGGAQAGQTFKVLDGKVLLQ